MNEYRAVERFDLRYPVLIKGEDIDGKRFKEKSTTKNISSNGLFCFIKSSVEERSMVQSTITLPVANRNQIKIEGKVVRIENGTNGNKNKNGIALSFNGKTALRF